MDIDIKKIIKFSSSSSDKILSRESSSIEFKESFNWSSKASYAKSMAAFSNSRGGVMIFGITNNPRTLKGLLTNNFEELDEAKITEYVNSVFSPEIQFEKITQSIRGKKVGILKICEVQTKPVICIKSDDEIKEAEIYYRYNGRSEKIKYPELRTILDLIKAKERKDWMEHLERISKIGPSNAAVVDFINESIEGLEGTIVIDKKLIPKIKFIKEGNFSQAGAPTLKLIGDVKPVSITGYRKIRVNGKDLVRLTDDPNAPVVKISDDDLLTLFPDDHKVLVKKLTRKYGHFRQNAYFYSILNKFKSDPLLCRTRYLNPKNTNSSHKTFYSPKIYRKFAPYYQKEELQFQKT